jgi:aryl sulfotransferase
VPERYRSPDEDSSRWGAVVPRAGDIVISARSKHGTTWVQAIVALLVFQTPELPAPLHELSPWVDWLGTPARSLAARVDGQRHRRFLKTHTPLDGLPLAAASTYVVVARHPLDAAVSLHHHAANLDRLRIAERTGQAVRSAERPPIRAWLEGWIAADPDPRAELDSLPGVMLHLGDAWARRRSSNVVLVHYDDLLGDLESEMRRLAGALGIAVGEQLWPSLVEAAGFELMREGAGRFAPDPGGILRDATAFFRQGTSGEGVTLLGEEERRRYELRVRQLGPSELVNWLHRDRW